MLRAATLFLLLALPALGLRAFAGPEIEPAHNTSYVPEDDPDVRALVQDATKAAEAGDFSRAADRLQALILSGKRSVVPVRGRRLYVSPDRWAALALLAERPPFGTKTLAAWRSQYDLAANAAFAGALAAGDETALLDLLDRYPAATKAPAVVLALSDRALERGDRDAARGFLDRFPECVAADAESLLASPAYQNRRKLLASLEARPAPEGWPTRGGAPGRSRNGDPLPSPDHLSLLWECPLFDRPPLDVVADPDQAPRSPRIPFGVVVDAKRVYVDVGSGVAILGRESGKVVDWAPDHQPIRPNSADVLLERSPGMRCATVHGSLLFFNRLIGEEWDLQTDNVLVAYDVERKQTVWQVPAQREHPDPAVAGVFFRGAPAVSRGRLYVYGGAREPGATESTKERAFLFCFEERTGRFLWKRFLGYGDTEAPASCPPWGGCAPAVSRGVAVVVTGVGVAAGLDARTGDILWLFRYDRQRPPERERLSEETRNQVPVRSRWAREPPRIVADRVYLAPPDSNDLYGCFLRGRRIPAGEPGAGGFYLESWDPLHRAEGHRNCVLEYLAGFRSGRVFCVGSPDRNFHAYESVLSLDVSVVSVLQGQGGALAYGRLPLTHLRRSDAAPMPPQLFGRPALAGDVLLVPTRRVLYRFEAGGEPAVKKTGPDPREVAILPPFAPQTGEPPKPGSEPAPLFGNLVSAGGVLYAVTFDRVLAYGERPATEPSPGKEKAPEKKG